MAGFQKFPVPKAWFIDFWNYNGKWIGNTVATAAGSFLFFLSMNRFASNRHRATRGVGNYIDPSHQLAPKAVPM